MFKTSRVGPVVAVLMMLNACSASGPSDDAQTDATESELRRGQTILRIPLLDYQGALLSSHNSELASKGVATVTADIVEFDSTKLATGKQKWAAASALVDDAQGKNLDLEMRSLAEPADYVRHDAKGMCWKGDGRKVVDLIGRLTDDVFSDQLSVHGWRYKTTKQTADGIDEGELPAIWQNWRGQGEAILMITASSDDGGEMHVGLIPKCP